MSEIDKLPISENEKAKLRGHVDFLDYLRDAAYKFADTHFPTPTPELRHTIHMAFLEAVTLRALYNHENDSSDAR